ncbi:MAG TPA: IS200/IS605 family transposase [candidate division Zixibacteria bacterium]|nr:IS200/IS605 family transposase [candidate division Zixibacteria bacterium]
MRKSYVFASVNVFHQQDKEVRDLEKARTCAYQANYHLICATKYRRKVLVGTVKVRLEEILKTIAANNGFQLLTARVHDGDHLFVSAPPRTSIPQMVRVFKCVSAQLLFKEFPQIKEQLWRGHLWSEGYAVRTAGNVTSTKIEEYINRT